MNHNILKQVIIEPIETLQNAEIIERTFEIMRGMLDGNLIACCGGQNLPVYFIFLSR